jgi:hypothetical protein
METKNLEFKWTTSRGRDTYGYNICSLYVNGYKVSSCNGGGYDMKGTALGNYIAKAFPDKLMQLNNEFYGLTYHDPNYDPGKAVIGVNCQDRTIEQKSGCKTVEQAEHDNESFGLERYQAFYSASSKVPTTRHTIPLIDGACGFSCVELIIRAIGLHLKWIPQRRNAATERYTLSDKEVS